MLLRGGGGRLRTDSYVIPTASEKPTVFIFRAEAPEDGAESKVSKKRKAIPVTGLGGL
jgi:hypothetical protein